MQIYTNLDTKSHILPSKTICDKEIHNINIVKVFNAPNIDKMSFTEGFRKLVN